MRQHKAWFSAAVFSRMACARAAPLRLPDSQTPPRSAAPGRSRMGGHRAPPDTGPGRSPGRRRALKWSVGTVTEPSFRELCGDAAYQVCQVGVLGKNGGRDKYRYFFMSRSDLDTGTSHCGKYPIPSNLLQTGEEVYWKSRGGVKGLGVGGWECRGRGSVL